MSKSREVVVFYTVYLMSNHTKLLSFALICNLLRNLLIVWVPSLVYLVHNTSVINRLDGPRQALIQNHRKNTHV